jgi:co-chaperonin GroES (HSP10)
MNFSDVLKPQGYKLLIAMPAKVEKKGSIYVPDELQAREALATIVGNVVAMGPLAYNDPAKFPTGTWCNVGDWVMFKPFSGSRFKINGQEFRLINDDTVDAVVEDPRLIERA